MNVFTEFTSVERAAPKELGRQISEFEKNPLACKMLDAFPYFSMILNQYCQIIFANKAFYAFVDRLILDRAEDPEEHRRRIRDQIIGKRPGEAVQCIHACENSGCGTSENCSTCGALASVLAAQSKGEGNEESQLACSNLDEPYVIDLRVLSKLVALNDEKFTVCLMVDISNEKHRHMVDRLFLHDISSTAYCVKGIVGRLADGEFSVNKLVEVADVLNISTEMLINEIEEQKSFKNAEQGDLCVQLKQVNSLDFLKQVSKNLSNHYVGEGKEVRIDSGSEDALFKTDPLLLRRILDNMIKNALEASRHGDVVHVKTIGESNHVEFSVHNTQPMKPAVQQQVFNRSFSTKGEGRGLGTYSIKLLTERYLKGKASFVSAPNKGTIFTVSYPIDKR